MKNTKLYSLIALFVMCAFTNGYNQSELAQIDSFLDSYHEQERLMGTVTLAKDGKVFYDWSGGTSFHRGLENGENSDQTIYGIGSVSTSMTAVIALQLMEEGKLHLNQPLCDFFPSIPQSEEITIAQLLKHRSGLFNFTADSTFRYWMHRNKTQDEMVKLISENPLQFDPGSRAEYSNTNYLLLGYILEEVSGKPYGKLLEERITQPLGMVHTYFGRDHIPSGQLSNSFIKTTDDWVTWIPETSAKTVHAAGGVFSNGTDLSIFTSALFSTKLISEESLELMKEIEDGFGMGLLPTSFHLSEGYGNYGGIDEYNSFVGYYPESKLTVTAVFNGLDIEFKEVLNELLSTIFKSTDSNLNPIGTTWNHKEIDKSENSLFDSNESLNFIISLGLDPLKIKKIEEIYPLPIECKIFNSSEPDAQITLKIKGEGTHKTLIIQNGEILLIPTEAKKTES